MIFNTSFHSLYAYNLSYRHFSSFYDCKNHLIFMLYLSVYFAVASTGNVYDCSWWIILTRFNTFKTCKCLLCRCVLISSYHKLTVHTSSLVFSFINIEIGNHSYKSILAINFYKDNFVGVQTEGVWSIPYNV